MARAWWHGWRLPKRGMWRIQWPRFRAPLPGPALFQIGGAALVLLFLHTLLMPARPVLRQLWLLGFACGLVALPSISVGGQTGGGVTPQGSGTQPVSLPWLNVKDYGAAVDGTTDDAAAVQATVNAVPATGGVVLFPGIALVGKTITLPTDRLVVLKGIVEMATNSGGLSSSGAGLRAAAAGFVGTALVSQVTPGAAISAFGAQCDRIVFDGNNTAIDLLVQTQVQSCRNSFCTYFNSDGNGLVWTGVYNGFIDFPRFFELGNTVAFPNGKSSLVLNSNANANTVDVWITQPHFESGRGSYLTSYDPTGTHPIDGVTILGGKMEWSGNAATGVSPAAAKAIAMPFALINNATGWVVEGVTSINGFNAAATHWRLQNTSTMTLNVICRTSDGLLDAQNPRFFIDLFSGSGYAVQATCRNGASIGSGTGAHIRVVESTVTGYTISSASQFIAPLSGIAVSYTNPTTGRASFQRVAGGFLGKTIAYSVAAGGAVNLTPADGDYQEVTITANVAVQINLNAGVTPTTSQTQQLRVTIFNASGGALVTAPVFSVGAGEFLLASAVTNPGNGTGVTYTFQWSPNAIGGARYREVARTAAF